MCISRMSRARLATRIKSSAYPRCRVGPRPWPAFSFIGCESGQVTTRRPLQLPGDRGQNLVQSRSTTADSRVPSACNPYALALRPNMIFIIASAPAGNILSCKIRQGSGYARALRSTTSVFSILETHGSATHDLGEISGLKAGRPMIHSQTNRPKTVG